MSVVSSSGSGLRFGFSETLFAGFNPVKSGLRYVGEIIAISADIGYI